MVPESLGLFLLKNICSDKLSVPQLARALGIHLGDFELRILRENNPKPEEVERLVKLTAEAWVLGVPALTSDQIWAVVTDWDTFVPHKERLTVMEGDWDEETPLFSTDLNPGTDSPREWVVKRRSFTLEAFCGTWRGYDSDFLRALRWRASSEQWNGCIERIWRFNPLELSLPPGRKPPRIFGPVPRFNAYAAIREKYRSEIKAVLDQLVLAGKNQVKLQEVLEQLYSDPPKSGKRLQAVRKAMAELGWTYNESSKVWIRPA